MWQCCVHIRCIHAWRAASSSSANLTQLVGLHIRSCGSTAAGNANRAITASSSASVRCSTSHHGTLRHDTHHSPNNKYIHSNLIVSADKEPCSQTLSGLLQKQQATTCSRAAFERGSLWFRPRAAAQCHATAYAPQRRMHTCSGVRTGPSQNCRRHVALELTARASVRRTWKPRPCAEDAVSFVIKSTGPGNKRQLDQGLASSS